MDELKSCQSSESSQANFVNFKPNSEEVLRLRRISGTPFHGKTTTVEKLRTELSVNLKIDEVKSPKILRPINGSNKSGMKKKSEISGTPILRDWTKLVDEDSLNLPAPKLPEKSLRFQKIQLERLLAGKIRPPPKKGIQSKHHIRALLIPINHKLRAEEDAEEIYDTPKKLDI